ncbi:MAG TPA: hypothetical protein VGF75_07825 [Candidatus Saccharimonadales bacterium]|jgi:hypothetical protein
MKDYQQRIVDERSQLNGRLSRLWHFIDESNMFSELPESEKDLLRKQYAVMLAYSAILDERTKLFES